MATRKRITWRKSFSKWNSKPRRVLGRLDTGHFNSSQSKRPQGEVLLRSERTTPQSPYQLTMWMLPFDLRHVVPGLRGNTHFNMKCVQASACQCARTALNGLLPHIYIPQGRAVRVPWPPACGSCSVPASLWAPSIRSSGFGKGPRWSLVGFINGSFHCSLSYIIWRKCMTQTWHNLHL